MGQCIEELIDNIVLDDTPSLVCFLFKVVKYQLRLNVRLPGTSLKVVTVETKLFVTCFFDVKPLLKLC